MTSEKSKSGWYALCAQGFGIVWLILVIIFYDNPSDWFGGGIILYGLGGAVVCFFVGAVLGFRSVLRESNAPGLVAMFLGVIVVLVFAVGMQGIMY
ncbi:MAG: hypothetical protein AAF525_02535 [Pseudomonadota bacterium]